MIKTEQEKLKQQIVSLIERNGIPVGTEYIAGYIVLPEHMVLNDLLSELVVERRLIRSYTLLANGEPDCTYNSTS
jgi:hypothetical protein